MAAGLPGGLAPPPGGRAWDETLVLVADDGVRLRAALWRDDGEARSGRGHVLLLHGRTEFLEKYAAPAAELVRRGFAVASLDWRGQGGSDRLTGTPLKGHVERFTDYHRDLATLAAHPAVAGLPGPRLVLAHSMGGTVALGAVLRGALRPDALILSAPMLGISMSALQRALAALIVPAAKVVGGSESWPPFPGAAEPYVFSGFDGNVLTDDRATFEWMVEALRREPRLRMGMPTLGWFAAARDEMAWLTRQGAIGLPGVCLLGSEEEVVRPDAVRAGAVRHGLKLVEIAGARHEVLISAEPARSAAWAAIDRFLETQGI